MKGESSVKVFDFFLSPSKIIDAKNVTFNKQIPSNDAMFKSYFVYGFLSFRAFSKKFREPFTRIIRAESTVLNVFLPSTLSYFTNTAITENEWTIAQATITVNPILLQMFRRVVYETVNNLSASGSVSPCAFKPSTIFPVFYGRVGSVEKD